MERKAYPSDVSDEEWAFVAPYVTLMDEDAPQRTHSLREVFNGLRYVVHTGMQWRMMAHDLPPWYTVYRTADGGHMALGAIEPHFYAELVRVLGLDPSELPDQNDRSGWPVLRSRFAQIFSGRSRAEWEDPFRGVDACVAPVLDMSEAPQHLHNRARETFVTVEGITQPAPAPRFESTPTGSPKPPPVPGQDTDEVLSELGLSRSEIGKLRQTAAIA